MTSAERARLACEVVVLRGHRFTMVDVLDAAGYVNGLLAAPESLCDAIERRLRRLTRWGAVSVLYGRDGVASWAPNGVLAFDDRGFGGEAA